MSEELVGEFSAVTIPSLEGTIFEDAPVIAFLQTRAQALEDGDQVSLQSLGLAGLAREHYKYPVYLTKVVYLMAKRAVESEKHCNDEGPVSTQLTTQEKGQRYQCRAEDGREDTYREIAVTK